MEILAPAGNTESGIAAINAGADAVYLGASAFSARANAGNFDDTALKELITRAHLLGVKVYVAMNTLVKESELDDFFTQLLSVWNAGADALILQDVFLGRYIHELYPQIVLHLSTQAGVCTESGARFAKENGFSRVILARETAFSEIKKIAKIIETEAFVQGALCTAFSGQCYFSSFAGGNSGNRGRCKQPCRKRYSIDRAGYEEQAYALSLSDLCVGKDLEKYIEAGVTSFKIEGRMRRAEYVSAAVTYYKTLLSNVDERTEKSALSDLKRTYNRGNYTAGLAFGQDKRFLSRAVQGHIGEKVGVVKVMNGKYFVETSRLGRSGDAFKILRKGKEIGGAAFEKTERRGMTISSSVRLFNGDDVFITTDTAVNEKLLEKQKTTEIFLSLYFKEGEKAIAECGDLVFVSEDVLQSAQNSPITADDIKTCFLKTDGLPMEVRFLNVCVEGNVFLPKSRLNAFRRAFFERLCLLRGRSGERNLEPILRKREAVFGVCNKKAAISCDFSKEDRIDVAILKPDDYTKPLPSGFLSGAFEKYLYYPAYLTDGEEELLAKKLLENGLDGVYAENYAGAAFAQKYGLKLFAGTGFNLTNSIAVEAVRKLPQLSYYALSKELSEKESYGLVSENAFVLCAGDLKLMDLCYCPFQKSCYACDKRKTYTLTDENGREFSLRRYVSPSGACRFEIYNCAKLVAKTPKGAGALFDVSVCGNKNLIKTETEEERKRLFTKTTAGHSNISMI